MFGIYTIDYWTRLPIRDPLTIAKWIEIEGEAEFVSDDLNVVIDKVVNEFSKKVYKRYTYDGMYGITECLLCYVLDEEHNVVGALGFDNKFHNINCEAV